MDAIGKTFWNFTNHQVHPPDRPYKHYREPCELLAVQLHLSLNDENEFFELGGHALLNSLPGACLTECATFSLCMLKSTSFGLVIIFLENSIMIGRERGRKWTFCAIRN